jgi:hypothetical protein
MTLLLPASPAFGYFVTNEDSPAAANSYGTTLTASGTTHTKGSWAAIHATIDYDLYVHNIVFSSGGVGNANTRNLVDLGIGPDSSNVTVIAENLNAANCGNNAAGSGWLPGGVSYMQVPLYVPAGTQLWGRTQSNTASQTVRVAVNSWGGPDHAESYPKISYIEALGESTANTNGTSITPGASGALGALGSLGGFTNDVCAVFMGAGSDDTTLSAVGYVGALTVGFVGQQELGLCFTMNGNASEEVRSSSSVIWADIPAAETIGARLSCTGTADSTMWAIAYGCVRG